MHIYDTGFFTSVIRLIVCALVGLPFFLAPKLLPKSKEMMPIKQFLEAATPFFYIFCLSKTVAIKLGLANLRESELMGVNRSYDKEMVEIMTKKTFVKKTNEDKDESKKKK